jgi:hypothetical protein
MFHSHVQVIGRSAGRSATGASAYRSGSVILDTRSGVEWDYTRKRGIDHSEITVPPEAPAWMLDRAALWNSVEIAEKRKDAQVAREFDIAIPIELDHEDKIALARKWVEKLVDLGMVVDWNCHHLDGDNPHFHAMATMRVIEGDGWGKKEREWNSPALIDAWRQEWADLANEALKAHSERVAKATGVPQEAPTISPLSLKAQGIERAAQQRIKPSIMAMAKKGIEWARSFVAERRIPPPPPEPEPIKTPKERTHERSAFQHLQDLLCFQLGRERFEASAYPGPGGAALGPSLAPAPSLWVNIREALLPRLGGGVSLFDAEVGTEFAPAWASPVPGREDQQRRGVELRHGGLAQIAHTRDSGASPWVVAEVHGRDAGATRQGPAAPAKPSPEPLLPAEGRPVQGPDDPGVAHQRPPVAPRPASNPDPGRVKSRSITR